MCWMTQMQIGYMMFKDWCKETFGSGVEFFQPTAPGYAEGYVK